MNPSNTEPMNKQILRLALPNMISNITVPLLGLVDLAIMGHLDSPRYLGAIALGGILFNFLYLGLGFLRMGTSGFTSQAWGQRDLPETLTLLARGLMLALGAGLVFILLQRPIGTLGFLCLDGSPEVKSLAREYFHIRIWAAPAALSVMVFNGWFLGMQNARYPMMVTLSINLLNVGLNCLFVFGLGMTSDGVAWATALSQYLGLLVCVTLFAISYRRLRRHWIPARLRDKAAFKRFLHVNRDILIRTLSIIFVLSFFTSASARRSDEILAVNQLLLQWLYVFSYFIDGFANAAEAITGKYVGRGNLSQLHAVIQRIFIWGIALALPMTGLYACAAEPLLRCLTNQAPLITLARDYDLWMALIPLTTFAAFIWDGVYVGATASKVMRNTLLLAAALFLGLYYGLAPMLGNHALWLALHAFMLSRGLLLSFCYKKTILQKKGLAL